MKVREETGLEVWLLFLHENPVPHPRDKKRSGCPDIHPTGLFGEEILTLRDVVCHESPSHCPDEMIYWKQEKLQRFSDYRVSATVAQRSRIKLLSFGQFSIPDDLSIEEARDIITALEDRQGEWGS